MSSRDNDSASNGRPVGKGNGILTNAISNKTGIRKILKRLKSLVVLRTDLVLLWTDLVFIETVDAVVLPSCADQLHVAPLGQSG